MIVLEKGWTACRQYTPFYAHSQYSYMFCAYGIWIKASTP